MALTAAPADQALLLDVQGIDTEIQRLTHRAASLPQTAELVRLAADRERLARELAEQSGALEDAATELRRVESDVEVVAARIRRDSERLQTSTSVKDIQGLEQELAALAGRQSDLEDIELAVMETVEQRQAAVDATRAAIEAAASAITEATASRTAAVAELNDERARIDADRADLVARIPDDLMALYERQRARYGVGASLLRGGVSGASGVALGASDMNTVRSAAPDAVLLCPDSNAILVRTAESGL